MTGQPRALPGKSIPTAITFSNSKGNTFSTKSNALNANSKNTADRSDDRSSVDYFSPAGFFSSGFFLVSSGFFLVSSGFLVSSEDS